MANDLNPGLYRFSGMYGAAYKVDPAGGTGTLLSEVIEVSGTVTRNRIEVPLVGTTKTGYKPGRETRDGTIRLQKIDTKWEHDAWSQMNQSLADRRKARDTGANNPAFAPFTIQIEYDDPDALGIEKWQLEGCIASWSLQLGFSITDDTVERDFPFTWERETPIYAFKAKSTPIEGGGTILTPSWYGSPPVPAA